MIFGKYTETVEMALGQLLTNKLRTALTMLGIVIGVAAVVILVSLGQGVQDFVLSSFSQFGSQFIIVVGTENADSGSTVVQSSLTDADLVVLQDTDIAPDLQRFSYIVGVPQQPLYNGQAVNGDVIGISEDYLEVLQFDVASGRGIDEDDLIGRERVALVGPDLVETVFDGANPIGEAIRIGGVNFRIIGVLQPTPVSLVSSDNSILIPATTAQQRLSGGRTLEGAFPINAFLLEARDETVVDAAVEQIDRALRISHELDDDDAADFLIISQQAIVDTVSTITGLLTAFLGVIAGISLFVGGIGIMNIMLVTVTERTREIGLRKAVGAQQGDILMQFLIESITLTVIGGLIGTVVALIGTAFASALIPDLTVQVQPSSILLAVVVSILVGAFFGAFPAKRAANMNPIDALRYE